MQMDQVNFLIQDATLQEMRAQARAASYDQMAMAFRNIKLGLISLVPAFGTWVPPPPPTESSQGSSQASTSFQFGAAPPEPTRGATDPGTRDVPSVAPWFHAYVVPLFSA
jgi:hypothetical protein